MVKAAKELGFEVDIDELERLYAKMQELDEAELDNVAGGFDGGEPILDGQKKCDDNIARAMYTEDEHGHNGWCMTAWHCFTATVHTESDSKKAACWSDYLCILASK